jgi:hypothetical protein
MSAHEIFICYSSKDEAKARKILAFLEAGGVKGWISARDVRPGYNYQDSIVAAIQHARVVVFLLSDFSNKSGEVKKELSLASSFDVPVIPVRLTPTEPNPALRYELATRQWVDVFPDLEGALDRVAAAVRGQLRPDDIDQESGKASEVPSAAKKRPPRPKKPVPTSIAEASRAPIVAPGSGEFEAIRTLLAHHVGPIAKLLIEKAAGNARSVEEFCDQLALHVRAPAERTAFAKAVRARLPAGT